MFGAMCDWCDLMKKLLTKSIFGYALFLLWCGVVFDIIKNRNVGFFDSAILILGTLVILALYGVEFFNLNGNDNREKELYWAKINYNNYINNYQAVRSNPSFEEFSSMTAASFLEQKVKEHVLIEFDYATKRYLQNRDDINSLIILNLERHYILDNWDHYENMEISVAGFATKWRTLTLTPCISSNHPISFYIDRKWNGQKNLRLDCSLWCVSNDNEDVLSRGYGEGMFVVVTGKLQREKNKLFLSDCHSKAGCCIAYHRQQMNKETACISKDY